MSSYFCQEYIKKLHLPLQVVQKVHDSKLIIQKFRKITEKAKYIVRKLSYNEYQIILAATFSFISAVLRIFFLSFALHNRKLFKSKSDVCTDMSAIHIDKK